MIENTFIHIQGVGPKTERNIWQKGIIDWHSFLTYKDTIISSGKDSLIRMQLEDSILHYNDVKYFEELLPASDKWRMFGNYKEKAVYLDIETSGDYTDEGTITVIGLYDGKKVYSFVNGQNLNEFEIVISSYDLVITFNGTCFDLPIIKKYFPGITLPAGHIDLKFLLNRIGYKGGLKKIEKDLGVSRDMEIEGLNGYDAIKLWEAYKWGDKEALDLLKKYNEADIVNLKLLMEYGYKEMKRSLLLY